MGASALLLTLRCWALPTPAAESPASPPVVVQGRSGRRSSGSAAITQHRTTRVPKARGGPGAPAPAQTSGPAWAVNRADVGGQLARQREAALERRRWRPTGARMPPAPPLGPHRGTVRRHSTGAAAEAVPSAPAPPPLRTESSPWHGIIAVTAQPSPRSEEAGIDTGARPPPSSGSSGGGTSLPIVTPPASVAVVAAAGEPLIVFTPRTARKSAMAQRFSALRATMEQAQPQPGGSPMATGSHTTPAKAAGDVAGWGGSSHHSGQAVPAIPLLATVDSESNEHAAEVSLTS
eukprot:COSAG01_NODE_8289_length_2841_cov_9.744712_1_plen_290_part_10